MHKMTFITPFLVLIQKSKVQVFIYLQRIFYCFSPLPEARRRASTWTTATAATEAGRSSSQSQRWKMCRRYDAPNSIRVASSTPLAPTPKRYASAPTPNSTTSGNLITAEDWKLSNWIWLIFQRGPSNVPTDGLVQTHETPQGFDILFGVVTCRWSDGHRFQRQDGEADAFQRWHLQPGRRRNWTYHAWRHHPRSVLPRGHIE